jgi:HSP20 family protein
MSESTTLSTPPADKTAPATRWLKPRYSVSEQSGAYEIRVLVPGASRETVHVSLKDSDLEITARRTRPLDPSWKPVLQERASGDFRLRLKLNVPVKEDAISGKVENGVLTVRLPLADAVLPRRIEIQ